MVVVAVLSIVVGRASFEKTYAPIDGHAWVGVLCSLVTSIFVYVSHATTTVLLFVAEHIIDYTTILLHTAVAVFSCHSLNRRHRVVDPNR